MSASAMHRAHIAAPRGAKGAHAACEVQIVMHICPTCLLGPSQAGMKHGLGTYVWPNGAVYKGEWADSCMHGVGSFRSPDGTFYEARPLETL